MKNKKNDLSLNELINESIMHVKWMMSVVDWSNSSNRRSHKVCRCGSSSGCFVKENVRMDLIVSDAVRFVMFWMRCLRYFLE